MATKPATMPTWATDVGATVDPGSSAKATGWLVGQKPPAKWMNWILFWIYQWILYLDAPVGSGTDAAMTFIGDTGAGSRGLNARAGGTAGNAATFAVGVTDVNVLADAASFNGTAVYVTTNVVGATAVMVRGSNDAPAISGYGANGGSNLSEGVRGVGAAYGVRGISLGIGVYGDATNSANSPGVKGDGPGSATTSAGAGVVGTGVYGVTGQGTYGVKGEATGNGYGVWAENLGTGYALYVAGDPTSPVRASVHIDPQNAIPTGAHALGDHFVDSRGCLWRCAVAGTPGTWRRVGSQVLLNYAKASGSGATVANSVSKINFTGVTATIPAGSLRAGSRVRVRAYFNTQMAAASNVAIAVDFTGGVSMSAFNYNTAGTNNNRMVEVDLVVADNGTQAYALGSDIVTGNVAGVIRSGTTGNVITNNAINTANAVTFQLAGQWTVANAGNILECIACIVEVID